jgi:hypothetical protein
MNTENQTQSTTWKFNPETGEPLIDGYPLFTGLPGGKWPPENPSQALLDVLAEQKRQVEIEGRTTEHDDEHIPGELSSAGSYSIAAVDELHSLPQGDGNFKEKVPVSRPWSNERWKPGPRRRMLVKFAALILAEIEKIDRKGE